MSLNYYDEISFKEFKTRTGPFASGMKPDDAMRVLIPYSTFIIFSLTLLNLKL